MTNEQLEIQALRSQLRTMAQVVDRYWYQIGLRRCQFCGARAQWVPSEGDSMALKCDHKPQCVVLAATAILQNGADHDNL